MTTWWRALTVCAAIAAIAPVLHTAQAQTVPLCSPGAAPISITGSASADIARTYTLHPFEVAAGTTRIEMHYSWADNQPAAPSNPLTQTVFDLGLWDNDGPTATDGFRGWSGSRGGRSPDTPVFVQADSADRGYIPGPIEAGTWHVEVGNAAIGPTGATYEVIITCMNPTTGPASDPDRVDPAHVAATGTQWYHGDFHMHGFHSNAKAPEWTNAPSADPDSFVEFARAGLDFTPVTDYVTTQHWDELGTVQRSNPDLMIWPSREIITYFGHATVFGETDSVNEYRHGYDGITLGAIQQASKNDGALFGVAHPTIFPGPIFRNFCRGCEFELSDEIDWDLVDTIEVLTGPVLVDDSDIGGPGISPTEIQQPFIDTAIDFWEQRLLDGYRITAVSGSDDKIGPGLGSSATAVFAPELSRVGITAAIHDGRAYVKTRGVADSPTVEVAVAAADGTTGMIGDTFVSDAASITVKVSGANGQVLRSTKDGIYDAFTPIDSDDFTTTFQVQRSANSGPLGTFWRVDTLDEKSLTTIGNPIFLTDQARVDASSTNLTTANPSVALGDDAGTTRPLPATGSPDRTAIALLVLLAVLARPHRRFHVDNS